MGCQKLKIDDEKAAEKKNIHAFSTFASMNVPGGHFLSTEGQCEA